MKDRELNRAVAKATGESVRTIQKMGFSLIEPVPFVLDPKAEEVNAWPKEIRAGKGAS